MCLDLSADRYMPALDGTTRPAHTAWPYADGPFFFLFFAGKIIVTTGFLGYKFPEKQPVCSPAPGLLLADEVPTWYKKTQASTKYVVQDHWGLGVQHLVSNGWGRKRLETSASMGLHFPQEQLTRITPIFARLLSSLRRFQGCHRNAYLQARNLAKTIARDKPVSTFECIRKH